MNNLEKPQKHYIDWNNTDKKVHTVYDSIHIKNSRASLVVQ